MNKDLLFSLYQIHSMSGSEKKMRKYLESLAWERGAWFVDTDDAGNLLITKGESKTYPCLAAHMDQVQHTHSKDFTCVEIGGDVMGYSPNHHEQQGLGADDKNGIYICLELLERFDAIKIAFFVGEEVGCKGSEAVDLTFFKDCRFIIEPDRRGGHDLITSMFCGSVCSKDFIEAIGADAYGYKEATGSITDVGTLVERGVGISCLNLSCGYYEAHTDHEVTCIAELENCLSFVEHIVETCTDVYPFEYVSVDRYGGWYSGGTRLYGPKYYKGYLDGYKSSSSCVALSASKDTKALDMDDIYNADWYDEDFDMMMNILEHDPKIELEEVLYTWNSSFYTEDIDVLRCIYEDAKELLDDPGDLMGDTMDFWDDGKDEPTLVKVS